MSVTMWPDKGLRPATCDDWRSLSRKATGVAKSGVGALIGFLIGCLLSACAAPERPATETIDSPKAPVSWVQVMYASQLSVAVQQAAHQSNLTGRLMGAIRRELQDRQFWSTEGATWLTLRIINFGLGSDRTQGGGGVATNQDRPAVQVMVETADEPTTRYPV